MNILKLNAKKRFLFVLLSMAIKSFSYYLLDFLPENKTYINLAKDILLFYVWINYKIFGNYNLFYTLIIVIIKLYFFI